MQRVKNKVRVSYNLYRKFLADIVFISGLFTLTILANYVPYVNVLISNFNPVLTGMVVVWFSSYIIFRPGVRSVLVGALALLACSVVFITLRLSFAAEIIGTLVYCMMVTVFIEEIRDLRRRLTSHKNATE